MPLSNKAMPKKVPANKAPAASSVAAAPTKKGWRDKPRSLSLLDKAAVLTTEFKSYRWLSQLGHAMTVLARRYDVVQHPESVPSSSHALVAPPPPEHMCSAPVEKVQLVDVLQVEPGPEQAGTAAANALVETETIVHSISGLGLNEAEEPMEVAPLEDLLRPAEVPSDVVHSAELTGVPAPETKAGELPLSTDSEGQQMLHKGFWMPDPSQATSA